MSGAMRKMAVYLGLVEDADGPGRPDYTDYGYADGDGVVDGDEAYRDDRADYRADPRAGYRPDPRGDRRSEYRPEPSHAPAGAVTALADRRPAPAPQRAELSKITTLNPRTYNEARTIGEHFRDGTPVIMNLGEMGLDDAKRLVDFSAGLVFGLSGTIERVSAKVFLLSPANVSVAAEDKARIAENGFFNQS
jgi:cell division inhibitor SepF